MTTSSRSGPQSKPGRSTTLRSNWKPSERRTDENGRVWLAPRVARVRSGHGKTCLQRWSRRPGCPALGEALERKPFEDTQGRTTLYFAQDQIDRLVRAEAAASPGDDGHWLTLDKALALRYASIATIYKLVKTGQVRTQTGGRSRRGGKISKANVLFSAEDLARYAAEHTATYRPHSDAVSLKEAADILGVALTRVYAYVHARRFRTVEHAQSGARKGGKPTIWLRRAEVEAEKARRLTSSRLTPYVDELGWRWLPLALVGREYGLTNLQVQWHADMAVSSWCLDGRQHSSDNLPPGHVRRHLTCKTIPNAGHPGPTLKVYLEADCPIVADRMAGRLSPTGAAEQAREIKRLRQAGKGPDGRPRSRPTAAPVAPAVGGGQGGATANGAREAAEPSRPPTQPRWDAALRELSFGGVVCTDSRAKPAPRQELLLAAFQELDWPESMDDPLPHGKLAPTLYCLNARLKNSFLRFSSHGGGQAVLWSVRAALSDY
jgi:hypothetical protein